MILEPCRLLARDVLPIPGFALGEPAHHGLDPFLPGFLALGVGDPFHVFLFVAVAKRFKNGQRLLVLPQGGCQVIRNNQVPISRVSRGSGAFHSALVQPGGFPDLGEQLAVAWQILRRSDSAKVPHSLLLDRLPLIAENQLAGPKPEGAVLLERRHAAEQPLMEKMRPAPFHGLLNFRAGGVDQFAQVAEDGSGKIGRAGDIRVHPGVSFDYRGHASAAKNLRVDRL
jgi:hypothetical protein